MKTQIVNFHNDEIVAIEKNGTHYVAMKQIAESLGLQWQAQFNRIKRDSVLKSTISIMDMVAEDNKKREMIMLPIEYLNGWLFGIDDKRIKCKAKKQKIIQYKKECYKVLNDYFTKGAAINPRKSLTPEQQRHVQKMVACKVANDETTSYSRVYSVLKDKFQVGTYKDIHQDDYPAVCAVFNEQPLEGEYIPKKHDMAATLKQEIESEIAKHGDNIDITSACVDNTRVRAILNILDKRGVNVEAARKEHCFTREQLYLHKSAVNTMIDQVKSFKRHCSQIITDTKYFEMQFGIFENQTKLAHDYCGRNLIGCGV